MKLSVLTTQCVYISRAREPWFLWGRANPEQNLFDSFPTLYPSFSSKKKGGNKPDNMVLGLEHLVRNRL